MALQKVCYISSNQLDLPCSVASEIKTTIEYMGAWNSSVTKTSLFDLGEYYYDETPNLRSYIKYHEPNLGCHDIIILY